jgi:hypothetical protein
MRAQDNAYSHYNPAPPTVQQVHKALGHLPTYRALAIVERAATSTGGWSRQLRDLHGLLLQNKRPE